MPGSVIQLSSAARSPLAPTVLLQQWANAPASAPAQQLPVSTSAAAGASSRTASRTAAAAQHAAYGQHSHHGGMQGGQAHEAALAASRAMLLPWFAVVVELLGDVVQLVRLEADVTADQYGNEQQQQVLPQPYDADLQLDDLFAAELALAGLGDALQLQANQSTALQPAAGDSSSSGTTAAALQQRANSMLQQQPMQISTSSSNLAGLEAAAAAAAGVSAKQDMAAIMDAVCALLMYPPREMDTLFMRLVIDKQHVLSGETQRLAMHAGKAVCLLRPTAA